jgi:SAM-dependent methyltransferase
MLELNNGQTQRYTIWPVAGLRGCIIDAKQYEKPKPWFGRVLTKNRLVHSSIHLRGKSMLNSEQRHDAPLPQQIEFWNQWNPCREAQVGEVSSEQASVIVSWLQYVARTDLHIIDIGCGSGWLCQHLTQFGQVTGTDLSDQVLQRAALRVPTATFLPGDFMTLSLDAQSYDVAVSLEVLAHVADQVAFLNKIADLLRPGGYLMLATQNRLALEQNDIPPPAEGQIRHWVDRDELFTLLNPRFEVLELFSITPQFNAGHLRYLNSGKLRSLLTAFGLSTISQLIKEGQEKAWLGWTLMALARARP